MTPHPQSVLILLPNTSTSSVMPKSQASNMGIDRLELLTLTPPNATKLRAMSKSVIPIRRQGKFRHGVKYALLNDAEVFHRWFRDEHLIGIVPNHFSGSMASRKLLEVIFDGKIPDHKITEIHFNVDVTASFSSIKAVINPVFFRATKVFNQFRSFKNGIFVENSFQQANFSSSETLYFGTERKRLICIYDKIAQLRAKKRLTMNEVGLLKHSALTRVEIRLRNPTVWATYGHLEDYMPMTQTFAAVNLVKKRRAVFKKPAVRRNQDHFDLLVEKYGFKVAKQFVRKNYPNSDRASMFGEVFRNYQNRKLTLNSLFIRDTKKFFASPITREEEVMFAKTRKEGP